MLVARAETLLSGLDHGTLPEIELTESQKRISIFGGFFLYMIDDQHWHWTPLLL
jgi:hypothetical protein